MARLALLLSLLAISTCSSASNLIEHERVSNQHDCFRGFFSDYPSWRGVIKTKFEKRAKSQTSLDRQLAQFDKRFGEQKYDMFKASLDCRTFEYEVDSHLVRGFVIKPKATTANLPVLIYNRGGNGNYGGVVFGSMMHNLFPIANKGFVVIGSQYRGTFTRSDNLDQFGGEDVNDVTALLDFIPSITSANKDKIGMFGASRGGMQTHLAVKHSTNIKAIATVAGPTDLTMGLTYRPVMERVYKNRIPNYLDNKQAELDKRSVLTWVGQLNPEIPILLLHGTNDKRVSVKHSKDFAAALSKHNIPHKLVLYPSDNHGLMINKAAANQELVNWFKKYL